MAALELSEVSRLDEEFCLRLNQFDEERTGTTRHWWSTWDNVPSYYYDCLFDVMAGARDWGPALDVLTSSSSEESCEALTLVGYRYPTCGVRFSFSRIASRFEVVIFEKIALLLTDIEEEFGISPLSEKNPLLLFCSLDCGFLSSLFSFEVAISLARLQGWEVWTRSFF